MGTLSYFKYSPYEDFDGKKVLNLGCGFSKYYAKNVVNLDAQDNCKPDVLWDLEKTPLPFEDNTFDLVFANHIMEHVKNWWTLANECARILKPGGKLEIWVPGYGSDSALGYRDHVNVIYEESFCGCFGSIRSGGNAWAAKNNWGHFNWMKFSCHKSNMIKVWWVDWAPFWLKKLYVTHLRNCSTEEGFFFTKATEKEYQNMIRLEEIRKNAIKNPNGNRAIPMPQMRKAAIHR